MMWVRISNRSCLTFVHRLDMSGFSKLHNGRRITSLRTRTHRKEKIMPQAVLEELDRQLRGKKAVVSTVWDNIKCGLLSSEMDTTSKFRDKRR